MYYHFPEDPTLLDGTFPLRLSPKTQERLECVADKDVFILEPTKSIGIEKIREDLRENGEASDFARLRQGITR